MKLALKLLAGALAVLVLLGAATYGWASAATRRALTRTVDTHEVDFPVPVPLDEGEIEALGLGPAAADSVARERAVERGRHLLESRYQCAVCHGEDLGGGVMVDAFPLGRILGPNLTAGEGGRVADYTPADWDRIVRHGVKAGGLPSAMPSQDFQHMSDRELSDIVAYVRSLPPVDDEVEPVSLGPLGKVLVATGKMPLSADLIGSHRSAHVAEPPEEAEPEAFGRHLAGTCTGCHGADLAGGPVVGGDPGWPPAANLTPHPDGLAAWTVEDFVTALREGTRPDGTAIGAPMTDMMPYARRMKDVELRALWTYLRSIPPVADDTE